MTTLSERGQRAAETVRILTEARAKIADRANWVKGKLYGTGRNGVPTACAIGAVGRAVNISGSNILHYPSSKTVEALRALAGVTHPRGDRKRREKYPFPTWASDIYHFNDNPRTTHKDVLAAFDLAIEQQCKIVQEEAAAMSPPHLTEDGFDSSAWTGR